MEPLGIYSPISGITTNQSESFNALLKRYGQWREAPLDSMVLGLYFLQSYHHNEIQRGYGGIGSYTLFSEYTFAAIPLDEVITSTVISPEEIVDKIKNNQIGPASTDFSQFTSAEELDKYISSQSCDFKLTEALHGSHAAQFSDNNSNEEIHESQAVQFPDNNSNEEIHESQAVQFSDNNSNEEIHESQAVQFSDYNSNEEIHKSQAVQFSDYNSNEELHESHNAQSSKSKSLTIEKFHESHAEQFSDSKSTEEVHKSHATQSSDLNLTGEFHKSYVPQPKSVEEAYEPTNTTQYARARYLYTCTGITAITMYKISVTSYF